MNLSSELRIRTPEGIGFSYPLAGPITRCMAWAIDRVVIVVLLVVAANAVVKLAWILPDVAGAFMALAYFAIDTFYAILLEWFWRGQTLGKRLLRLRVTDAYGFRLQFHQVLLRNLIRPIDSIPFFYMVGGLACLFSRRAQRLGDLAAGTIVVHLARHREPDLEQLLAGKFNSLREHPHLAARLRQRVSAEEARIGLQAVLRREELDAGARVTLFSELAGHYKSLVAFPAEVVEGLPDEQYVRNVVDILFRTRAVKSERKAEAAV